MADGTSAARLEHFPEAPALGLDPRVASMQLHLHVTALLRGRVLPCFRPKLGSVCVEFAPEIKYLAPSRIAIQTSGFVFFDKPAVQEPIVFNPQVREHFEKRGREFFHFDRLTSDILRHWRNEGHK